MSKKTIMVQKPNSLYEEVPQKTVTLRDGRVLKTEGPHGFYYEEGRSTPTQFTSAQIKSES